MTLLAVKVIAQVGVLLVLIIGGSVLLGLLLDSLLGTKPAFIFILLLASIPATLWTIYRYALYQTKQIQDFTKGGRYTVNWNGKRRWIALLLVIASVIVMLNWPPVVPVIQLPGEVYPAGWDLFGLHVTNSLAGSVVVWILIGLLVVLVARNRPEHGGAVPRGGFYNLFEMGIEGLYGFIGGIAPAKYLDFIFKMFMTIFIIVLLSNWMELVPGVDSVGFLEPHVEVDDSGQPVALDGFETGAFLGFQYLNAKCPWIDPAEAETLTTEQQAARADTGCLTGTGQPLPESSPQSPEAAASTTGNAEVGAGEAGAVVDLGATPGDRSCRHHCGWRSGSRISCSCGRSRQCPG